MTKIGNFEAGKEADFVVLNWAATDLQKLRFQHSKSLEDKLFALMMLGDDWCLRLVETSKPLTLQVNLPYSAEDEVTKKAKATKKSKVNESQSKQTKVLSIESI